MNGTDLSLFRSFLSIGAFAVPDLFKDVAMTCEKLIIFWPSLDRTGFLAEWADV